MCDVGQEPFSAFSESNSATPFPASSLLLELALHCHEAIVEHSEFKSSVVALRYTANPITELSI